MDYCLEATKAHIEFNKEYGNILFERMEKESDLIFSCLENDYHIILEEADNATDNTKTVSLWEKIKAFFAKLFGVFQEKVNSLFERNKKWMDDNFNKFDKLDYSNIKISLIPFWWDESLNKSKTISGQIESKLRAIASNSKSLEQYKNTDSIKKDILKDYLDENGDLTNGLKNLYRVGNTKGPLKTVDIQGEKLKEQVSEMKDYCFNYGKDATQYIKGLMNRAQNEIKVIEGMIKTATTESFCLLENSFYSQSSISICDNINVLLEEGNDNQDQQQNTGNNNSKPKNPKPTNVEVTDTSNKEENEKDKVKETYKGLKEDQLGFAKSVMEIFQLNISALMTVMEERFNAYLNALKGILGKTESQKADNNPGEENPENIKVKNGQVTDTNGGNNPKPKRAPFQRSKK